MRLGKNNPSLRALRSIARDAPPLELDPGALADVRAALSTVENIVASGKPAYGINTGFGRLSQTRIPAEALEQLQLNIVLSHAAGTGPLERKGGRHAVTRAGGLNALARRPAGDSCGRSSSRRSCRPGK